MPKTKQTLSSNRRAFCANTLGLLALGPLGALGLSGCGAGADAGEVSGQAAPKRQGAPGAFTHPGLLHTQADFDRISQKVAARAAPWFSDWLLLLQNNLASNTWNPDARPVVYRNDGVHGDNVQVLQWDVMAAYLNALQWKITGNTAAADTAVRILNAWGSTLTAINTTDGHYDGFLAAGLQGYQFANVAEIMRGYSGWAAADIATFQQMMLNVFYPMVGASNNNLQIFSSWDLCAIAASVAIAVLCDDQARFDDAVRRFQHGTANGAIAQMTYYIHPGYLGQTQESGRDQGHNTLSIALVTVICEMAWNQGVDLYGYDNNRVLAACEYTAKGNLIQSGSTYYTVPFAPYAIQGFSTTTFATGGQGIQRPAWALIYNHYANRMGLAAPYTKKFSQLVAPETGGSYPQGGGTWDQLGYGTLLFTRDPLPADAPPSGLTAVTTAGQVVLSWWGSTNATSYNVKRATAPAGPYTVIATGITDLLTYTDRGLANGTYYYVVTAVTPSGETAASNQAQAVAGSKLHTLLAFDEGAGAAAGDTSGNGHGAALVNGAAWAPGKGGQGSALALNGGGAYASLPANLLDTVGDFTIAAWVYWNGGQTWARIFDFGTNTLQYMFLSPRTSRGTMCFAVTLNGGFGECIVDAPAPLPAGQWTHVAVTLSGTDLAIYVNGTVVKTASGVFIPPYQLGHTTQNWLGRSQYSGDPTFNGMIDDFRILQGAASAADIAALCGATSNLHTWLTFGEGGGATAADASGNGHTATLAGTAAWTAGRQPLAKALSLPGGGAHVSLPAGLVDNLSDFTMAAWVYWNGNQTWARILDFGSNTTRYMFLSPRTGRGTLGFAITTNGSRAEYRVDAPAPLPSGQWVHVAVTLAGADFTIYVNGVAVKTASGVNLPPLQLGTTTQNWLGRSQFSSDPSFSGKIDDFRIYRGAASAADIAVLAGAQ
ncbi:LamG-like jellyroll fold domain-containing protein [Pseudoduganella rivuli]|uniref:LamG-like jellyroll fold domain-containing protein n=1 Tax=Pseudoduganella rivuli TaxID=2666085 RepID=UPI0018A1DFDA|nr:LamG-like jellyroll fold domain-containing protein [Pseudoduganella rivuli]